jgi:hypothetical protein
MVASSTTGGRLPVQSRRSLAEEDTERHSTSPKSKVVNPTNNAGNRNDVVKVLFLAANPSGTNHLALDEEIRAIDAKVRGAEHRDRLDLKPHFAVRLDDLSGYLMRHKPHVVHFSGHGAKSGAIILGGSGMAPQEVPPEGLADLFRVLKDNIRIVVLNACYSAKQAEAIANSIDCVVGMTDSIEDDHAIAFAAEFYQALAFGRSVQVAFDLGLTRLKNEGMADPATLVKFHERKGVKPAEIVLIADTTPPFQSPPA